MMDALALPVKPPVMRTRRAALEAAATTEGSSTLMGTSTSRLFTRKFRAMPMGSP